MRTDNVEKLLGLDGSVVSLRREELDRLEARLDGPLLRAGDDGWDDAVEIWNGMVARAPALVAQPGSTAGVAAAVDFAATHRVVLGIKGGGHNIGGTALAPGGLTLDMSRMRGVTVHPDARLVDAGPGCRLGDVDRAA